MAQGLYDIEDRDLGRFDLRERAREKRPNGLPLRALAMALLGGSAVALAVAPQMPWAQPAPRTTANFGGVTINASFNPCGGDRRGNCVLSPREFSYGNEVYHLADVRTPDGQFPACAAEERLAGKAERTLIGILNGGAFESRPDPADSDPRARILIRDGVSIGQIMIAKGVAQPWAPEPYNWCARTDV